MAETASKDELVQHVVEAHPRGGGGGGIIDSIEAGVPGHVDKADFLTTIEQQRLSRGLSQRHVSLIAIAGAIGTGLFLGLGSSIQTAGPLGALLGYVTIGLVVCAVQFALGEVTALLPVTGSFVRHAEFLADPALGFAVGWNIVYGNLLSIPTEITAICVLFQFWTDINSALWIMIFIVLTVAIGVSFIGIYGEIEFYFALLKILFIIFLIILGLVIDLGGVSGTPRIGFRYWKEPGPFVEYIGTGAWGNFLGYWSVMTAAVFSFAGVESIAMAAAETKNPRIAIPNACKRVFARVAVFYVLAVLVVGMLVPSDDPRLNDESGTATESPFVIAASAAGLNGIPSLVNAIVITSAWSASNQALLSGTRVLYSLALKRQAPKIFLRTTPWGAPYVCVALYTAFMFLAFMSLSEGAMTVFWWLVDLTACGVMVSWIVILFNHWRLIAAMKKQGLPLSRLPWHNRWTEWSTPAALAFVVLVLFTGGFSVFTKGNWDSVTFVSSYLDIPLVLGAFALWKIIKRTKWVKLEEIALVEALDRADQDPGEERRLPKWQLAPVRHNGVYVAAFKPAKRAFSSTAAQKKQHHFDTLKFVRRLKGEGFSEEQAVAMMRVLNDVIEESIQNLTRTMVLKEDAERSTYTQKVDFAKLRSELANADSTEAQLTRSSHERLSGDLAKLNSRLRDEIGRTQASVRLDLNLEKGRIREEANGQEMRIKETEARIDQEVANLRERVETVKFSTLQWLIHVLLDIEGTVCPISFVKETLFPYAVKALPDVVQSQWESPAFEKYKSAFPQEYQESAEKLIEHVNDLTERNVKIAYFKDLQGYLWEEGYKSGAYSGPFFEDVVPALNRWKQSGIDISIYSSGSVFAQKLLFGHVNNDAKENKKEDAATAGATVDLQPLISQWFDTVNAGLKLESSSYTKISELLEVPSAQHILFLSDNVKELEAAKKANFNVALVVRPGNDEVPDDEQKKYQVLESFDGLILGEGNTQNGRGEPAAAAADIANQDDAKAEQANGDSSDTRPAAANEADSTESAEQEAEEERPKKKQKTEKGKATPEKNLSKYESPFSWSAKHKGIIVLFCCASTLHSAYSAGAYSMAAGPLRAKWHVSQVVFNMGVTVWAVGFGCSPMVLAPFSEINGRRPVFLASGLVMLVSLVGCGVTDSFAGMLVARFFNGVGGSTFATMCGGVISDIFHAENRNTPMALYSGSALFGTGFGPFIAGFMLPRVSWRWVFYHQAISLGCMLALMCFFFSETRGSVLLIRRCKAINQYLATLDSLPAAAAAPGYRRKLRYQLPPSTAPSSLGHMIYLSLTTPFRLLSTEPVVFFFSLWAAFAWALQYMTFSVLPLVFSTTYHFDTQSNGAVFSTICIANIIATSLSIYQERLARQRWPKLHSAPEGRLYFACLQSALLPIGLFWFGWTATPSAHVHWISPVFALGVAQIGIFSIYLAVFNYLADVYHRYASSALAGQSFCRNILAAIFPAFTDQMFRGLGFGGASSLLGATAVILTAVPWVLVFFGETIRRRSKIASEIMQDEIQAHAAAQQDSSEKC
ncbi:hypothetical protein DV738_g4020, partial [Chaetothyriales sp. CBS 135597]